MALTELTPANVARFTAGEKGINRISLTNFGNTSEPKIAAGSVIEHNGTAFEASIDEAGTGWGGIGDGNAVYMYIDTSGNFTYSITAPTWDTSKQGYYNGTDRCFGGVYRTNATTYTDKYLIRKESDLLNIKHYGTGNIDILNTLQTADVITDNNIDKTLTGGSFATSAGPGTFNWTPASGIYDVVVIGGGGTLPRVYLELFVSGAWRRNSTRGETGTTAVSYSGGVIVSDGVNQRIAIVQLAGSTSTTVYYQKLD